MPLKKKIEQLENYNYYLYILISLLLGVVFFVSTYFTSSKVTEVFFENEADKVFKIVNVSEIGFDIEVASEQEVKVSYYFGKSTDSLIKFFESKDFIKNELQQFRSAVPDTNNFVQIEIEKRSGQKIKSRIQDVNDMLK
jgi:hypothetical protein